MPKIRPTNEPRHKSEPRHTLHKLRDSISYAVLFIKPSRAPILAQNVKVLPKPPEASFSMGSKRLSILSHQILRTGMGKGSKLLHPALYYYAIAMSDTDHAYVLHPYGRIRLYWDMITCLFVIYLSWTLPFYFAFDWLTVDPSIAFFNTVLDIWFIVDIFLNFKTGFVEFGMVCMNPKRIVKKYGLSIWFPIDVLASLPLELLASNTSEMSANRKFFKLFLKYCKLPKLLRITRLVKSFKRYSRYNGIFSLLAAYLFIVHLSR